MSPTIKPTVAEHRTHKSNRCFQICVDLRLFFAAQKLKHNDQVYTETLKNLTWLVCKKIQYKTANWTETPVFFSNRNIHNVYLA